MAAYFFDSSALVKRYARESGTTWVVSLFKPAAAHRIYVARIALVEVVSALARRERARTLSPTSAAKTIARFRRAFTGKFRRVEITKDLIERAATLAEKHALRGYDALQLAAALDAHESRLARGASALTLISADDALNAAALLEGLSVDNPNLHK